MTSKIVFNVMPLEQARAQMLRNVKAGKPAREAQHTFPTAERLLHVLSGPRLAILRVMLGAGPLSVRELARRVDRDIKSVHRDVTALRLAGVIDRTEGGGVEFPYQQMRVDFSVAARRAA